jgi:superfamily I DNA/RNA helicase
MIESFLRDTPVEQISYTTFMRSAAKEACVRFGISEAERRELWFRTLHSTCYRVLGLTKDKVVDNGWLKEFGEKHYFPMDVDRSVTEMEEIAEAVLQIQAALDIGAQHERFPGTFYRGIYNLSRLLCSTAEELDAVRLAPHPKSYNMIPADGSFSSGRYADFVLAYEKAKRSDGVWDFVDFLERVLREHPPTPPWKYAVIDEFQDYNPLQGSVSEYLYDGCKLLTLAGDDDQSIFSFQGANAASFLAYRDRGHVMELRRTHRFGQRLVDYSQQIARRVADRIEKHTIGLPGRENNIQVLYDWDPAKLNGHHTLLLHRHVRGCRAIGKRLIAAGIPFWNERGANPLGKSTELAAYEAWRKMIHGVPIYAHDLSSLLEHIPSVYEEHGERTRLVIHGQKKTVREMLGKKPVEAKDLVNVFTPAMLNRIQANDTSLLRIHFTDYYEALLRKGIDPHAPPHIIVSTIHGAKGREFDHVQVWMETFPKALRSGSDDEHRIAYVAVTRTRGDLDLIMAPIVGAWTSRYPYPEVP